MYRIAIAAEAVKIRSLGLSREELEKGYKIAYKQYEEAVLDGDDGNGKIRDLYIRKEALGRLLGRVNDDTGNL